MTDRMLDLKKVIVDPTVVIRHVDKNTVARYKDTESLPPIDVFEIGSAFVLADGLHRLTAAKEKKGVKQIKATIHSGNIDNAKEFAVMANLKHGLPLNEKARYEAIRRYAALHPNDGVRVVAKAFNCSHMTVARALKPAKKKPEGSVHVQQGRPTTVPTGPKAAKAPSDVFQALMVVLEVISDQTVALNLVTYLSGSVVPKEIGEKAVKNLKAGADVLDAIAQRVDLQLQRKPTAEPTTTKKA